MAAKDNSAWPKGVGQPAIRALTAAGYTDFTQLAGVPLDGLKRLHGVGPTGLARIQAALEAQGLSFG